MKQTKNSNLNSNDNVMITIIEYLLSKSNPKTTNKDIIEANDDNIQDIVRSELSKLGPEADLNHIDVSKVTNMDSVFRLRQFNGDISAWDVSNVLNMDYMFQGTLHFNCDLSNWDVSNVTSMTKMFSGNAEFEGKGLENWKISQDIEYMDGMFWGCKKLKADLSNWDVKGKKIIDQMFSCCLSFECDLSSWEINKYASRIEMFKLCPIAKKKKLQPKFIL